MKWSMKAGHSLLIFFLPILAVLASGCSTTVSGKRVDYEAARTLPRLEIPPDLSSLPADAQSARGGANSGTATYSRFEADRQRGGGSAADTAVLPQYQGMRIERAGAQRWLVVNASAERLWPQVLDFLGKMGLTVITQQPQIGLIETDWAENRAKAGGALQRFVSKITGKGYGSGLRDKYRVRLERGGAPGTTEIYLTHRGMVEAVATSEYSKDFSGRELEGTTVWQPRPPDPELQAEMLRLLMVHLGSSAAEARLALQTTSEPDRAQLSRGKGAVALTLKDELDVAWRRVGLSLDVIGYVVEDEDRSNWVYFVRAVSPVRKRKKEPEAVRYQVALKETGDGTAVRILDVNGKTETTEQSGRILELLYEQLK